MALGFLNPALGAPLFESQETLALTLTLPLDDVLRGKANDQAMSATLSITGGAVAFDLQVNVRGHSRKEVCQLPPLKLNFKREQTEGTVFDGQNKVKLVTHCNRTQAFKRYLQQEFSIYRAYATLDAASFRVRMLDVTYRDSEGKRGDINARAFLIESDRELSERLGYAEVPREAVAPALLDPQRVTTFALFQYLIGNTDWAILKGRGDGDCCHNGVLLDGPNGLIVAPYDFDQAGLINAQYALPAKGLGIRGVRQRLYRGLCVDEQMLQNSIDLFNEKRSWIEAEFPLEGPEKSTVYSANKRARKYIADFYEVVNDPAARQKAISGQCRGNGRYWAASQ